MRNTESEREREKREDEIGGVKKKAVFACNLSFYIGYFGDSFERKKNC